MSIELRSRTERGFTLLELLVVIAIIGILAALLLPALSRAKASAKSAACKSNLHQIGIGLRLYVDEFESYPLTYFKINPLDPKSPTVDWRDALAPYLTTKKLLWCPWVLWEDYYQPYGYNMDGSSREMGLGLGGFGPHNLNIGPAVPLGESQVRVPSDMIAFGDACGYAELTGLGFGWPGCFFPTAHKDRLSNGVFCDGHIESAQWASTPTNKLGVFMDATHIRRWNYDNEPHPETWPAATTP